MGLCRRTGSGRRLMNIPIWLGYKAVRNKKSTVFYANNIAMVDGEVIDNRALLINRRIVPNAFEHYWDLRRPERGVSFLDAYSTINAGIKFRSDRKYKGRWQKRWTYLWGDTMIATLDSGKIITAWRMDYFESFNGHDTFLWMKTLNDAVQRALADYNKNIG